MYDRIQRKEPKKKRDSRFVIIIIVTVALIIGFAVWVWSWNNNKELHTRFVMGLSNATVASYQEGGADGTTDGKAFELGGDALYELYGKLTYTDQCKRTEESLDSSCTTVYYADGAKLMIWQTDIDVRGWTRDKGIYVEFTYPDGDFYSFITDRLQYIDILNVINS